MTVVPGLSCVLLGRQIMEVPMEAGVLVQCDFMAVIKIVENEFRDHPFQPGRAGRTLHRARSARAGGRGRGITGQWIRSGAAMRLFVNRRVDALTLLAAVAGRTERVLPRPGLHGVVRAAQSARVCL